jgi:phthiocerol/phenolphthiocerol synthesis type-I polyketide synthase C
MVEPAALELPRSSWHVILGAEVFATAGSDEKRDFLRLLGADHVLDSRTLAFSDQILHLTGGRGVDVVLNSLAGEAINRNLRLLKPFGRFLELGKRDFYENTRIGLRPFRNNISYFGIDADQLLVAQPAVSKQLFQEVMALFTRGVLHPLPYVAFEADHVVDAFRHMQQARHIGKVVVSLANARPAVERSPHAQHSLSLPKEATWLVTGGLSGFGLESARWLAAQGVGHLVLVGRRGLATHGAKEAMAALTAHGVQVEAHACDITDAAAVSTLIEHVRKTLRHSRAFCMLPPSSTMRSFTTLMPRGCKRSSHPSFSAPGTCIKPRSTFRSNTSYSIPRLPPPSGNPGQASYVAANAGLEGLAAMRRSLRLPAACIGWGPIEDAGYLTRNTAVCDSLGERLGKPPLTAQEALGQLGRILSESDSLAVANFDWNTLARLLPSAESHRFAVLNRSLKNAGLSEGETDFRALIAGKTPEEIAAIVQGLVVQEVAQIVAIGADRIDPLRSLHDLGLDSLMAVELALGLEQRFGIQLPVMMLNESPTAEKVTRRIVDKLLGEVDGEDSATNTIEAMVHDLAKQHGESLPMEDAQQIAEDARALVQQGATVSA